LEISRPAERQTSLAAPILPRRSTSALGIGDSCVLIADAHLPLLALAAVSACRRECHTGPQVRFLQDHELEAEAVTCLLRVGHHLNGNLIDSSKQVGIRAEAMAEFRVAGDLIIRENPRPWS
jgi:hypothetical protein